MQESMEITALLDFEICDDHVKTPSGLYYFFRIQPPNLSILNDTEKMEKIKGFESFLDSNENPFQIFVLDKTEDLTLNKQFVKGLNDKWESFTNDILNAIEKMQGDSRGVQRAFYVTICVRKKSEHELFLEQLKNNSFDCYLAKKDELITVMRNFSLRDFTNFDIYTFEKEAQALYDKQKYDWKQAQILRLRINQTAASTEDGDILKVYWAVRFLSPNHHCQELSGLVHHQMSFDQNCAD